MTVKVSSIGLKDWKSTMLRWRCRLHPERSRWSLLVCRNHPLKNPGEYCGENEPGMIVLSHQLRTIEPVTAGGGPSET
ncbi:hypothetical protein [Neobacillus niacini]|uniref:hypothetical protein n=1 Tax=Neobacillus niacini TaxID=86668 RepID=UPI0021CB970C|nr:hypothetical protein [Neobacillus niacini]MCM3763930.1 hypothetical protein [Neobacillus niacini]